MQQSPPEETDRTAQPADQQAVADTPAGPDAGEPIAGTAQGQQPGDAAGEAQAPGGRAGGDESSRIFAALGAEGVAEGLALHEQEEEAAALSAHAAREGMDELQEGAGLLAVAETLGRVARRAQVLSRDEVGRGMELAGMSGQIAAVGTTVNALGIKAIAPYLAEISRRLQVLAVDDFLRSQGSQDLAQDVHTASVEVARHGAGDMAEGMVSLGAAADLQEASDEFGRAGEAEFEGGLTAMDIADVLQARAARPQAAPVQSAAGTATGTRPADMAAEQASSTPKHQAATPEVEATQQGAGPAGQAQEPPAPDTSGPKTIRAKKPNRTPKTPS